MCGCLADINSLFDNYLPLNVPLVVKTILAFISDLRLLTFRNNEHMQPTGSTATSFSFSSAMEIRVRVFSVLTSISEY